MSFVVTHPFEEKSYPEGVRNLWASLPTGVRDKIVEMGRRFGTHAMVEGAVPVTFDNGTDELIRPFLDGKYLQSIPEVYKVDSTKFWVDASVLNYSMFSEPLREAQWKPVVILGTARCVISNVGDGAAIDVDLLTGNEELGVSVSGSTVWVEPNQGAMVTFTQDITEGSELVIGWTSEDGIQRRETMTLPAITGTKATIKGTTKAATDLKVVAAA